MLFDNLPAVGVLGLLQEYSEVFYNGGKSESQIRRDREWIGARQIRKSRKRAWDCLFRNLSLDEIVNQINEIWLDPDYELVVIIQPSHRVVLGIRR